MENKCSVEEIRKRFDSDVERFSSLETAQATTIDAVLSMELITKAALSASTPIKTILDIGCGAGNNTLKLLQSVPDADCVLLDLSLPMLERAQARVAPATSGTVQIIQADFRVADLAENSFDVILAAAVFHHLRDDADWGKTFQKVYSLLRPGGSVWITDLVTQDNPAIFEMMWQRYGAYLTELGGEEYCQKVFDYIAYEDSPRSVTFQLDLLKEVGFSQVEILHKNSCFAAFGAIK